MTFTYAFFIYLIVWWVVLFTVLPIGVKTHKDTGRGFDTGAPEKPELKKKLILTSVISLGVFLVIWAVLASGFLSWENITHE